MAPRMTSFIAVASLLAAPLHPSALATSEPAELRPGTTIKLSIRAADVLQARLEQCLTAALEDLEGVTIVAVDEMHEIRVLAIDSSGDDGDSKTFVSVLVLAPQTDGLKHLEFIAQHCPDSTKGKTPAGKTVPFPMSLPLGYLE